MKNITRLYFGGIKLYFGGIKLRISILEDVCILEKLCG